MRLDEIRLGVNIDHVATVRNARGTSYPDPLMAAKIVKEAGGDGITAHLREDRRHIVDQDISRLKQQNILPLNLEMAATDEMQKIALDVLPNAVCLVPEKREEVTTEGGLDVISNRSVLLPMEKLQASGIRVSLFIDPDPKQIEASADCGADDIELHTGSYAHAFNRHGQNGIKDVDSEYNRLHQASEMAHRLGLKVNAGHGLNYHNTRQICHLPHLEELNIGHSIISRAVFDGLHQAVREMRELIDSEVLPAR